MMGGSRLRLAFVSPRWAPAASGGAEVLSRLLAEHLVRRGHHVEAFATCAEDPHTWSNDRPAGSSRANGVTVRRFPVDPCRVSREFLNIQRQINLGHRVTREEEERWIGGSVTSGALNDALAALKEDFDAFIFVPYLFGITYFGSMICADKSLLIPCLHDEPFAYLSIYRDMFARFRGFLFNSGPEMELATRLYGLPKERTFLVSMGFDDPENPGAERFRTRRNLPEPFLLYAGRREEGKNTHLLVEYFKTWRRRGGAGLKLVLMGTGGVGVGEAGGEAIVDLGFAPEQEKIDAMAACLAFCQPSVNESFSIVLMETWLAGRPVLVHGDCAVTRDHVVRSNGGLWFDDYFTFGECLTWFRDHPAEALIMAESGRAYVRRNYSWDAVMQRFEKAVGQTMGSALDS